MNRRRTQQRQKKKRGFNLQAINNATRQIANVAANTANVMSKVDNIDDVKHIVESNIVDQFEAKLKLKYNTFRQSLLAELAVVSNNQTEQEQEMKMVLRDLDEQLQYLNNTVIPDQHQQIKVLQNKLQNQQPYVAMTAVVVPEEVPLLSLPGMMDSKEVLVQHERVLLVLSDRVTVGDEQYVKVRRVLDNGTVEDYYSVFNDNTFTSYRLTTT